MNAGLLTMILAGSALSPATDVTGRELALLRVILRQSMSADQHAAQERGDALTKDRVSPLGLVSNDPNLDQLHGIMTSETNDEYKRFRAARAMAYLGDARCIDTLVKTLAGEFAVSSSGIERSHAAACLLYLNYDFPKDFLFTRLPNSLYPELNTLLEDPNQSAWPSPTYSERYNHSSEPNLPYTSQKIATSVRSHLGYVAGPVTVRGPLSTIDVEQRELQSVLDEIVEFNCHDWIRIPFSGFQDEWLDFRSQMRAGDLNYSFITDEIDWSLLGGREGCILIREGTIAAMFITRLN